MVRLYEEYLKDRGQIKNGVLDVFDKREETLHLISPEELCNELAQRTKAFPTYNDGEKPTPLGVRWIAYDNAIKCV